MKCNPALTTIAIDLAKSIFQLLAVDARGNVLASHRLSRAAFLAFWHNRAPVRVVMEGVEEPVTGEPAVKEAHAVGG